MEDMTYEYLIRRVYNSGRSYNKGADADIYRDMEMHHNNLTTQSLYTTQDRRELEYRRAFSKVRANVKSAIENGIKQLSNSSDRQDLQKLSKKLTVDFYSKERLDAIIKESNNVFHKNGLEIG